MKRLIAVSVLFITVLIFTSNTRADVMGWKFAWDDLSSHNLSSSSNGCSNISVVNTNSFKIELFEYGIFDNKKQILNDFESQLIFDNSLKFVFIQSDLTLLDAINNDPADDRQFHKTAAVRKNEFAEPLKKLIAQANK